MTYSIGVIASLLYHVLFALTAARRRPDQIIYRDTGAYMLRWWLFGKSKTLDRHGDPKPRRPFGFSVYVHCFIRSDDDRARHDHPWDWFSLLLRSSYIEHTEKGYEVYDAGCMRFGKAEDAHRIELFSTPNLTYHFGKTDITTNEHPVWTLFITGRWRRDWGFHCPQGWTWWRNFDERGGCE